MLLPEPPGKRDAGYNVYIYKCIYEVHVCFFDGASRENIIACVREHRCSRFVVE